jgi:hypothetical protein
VRVKPRGDRNKNSLEYVCIVGLMVLRHKSVCTVVLPAK